MVLPRDARQESLKPHAELAQFLDRVREYEPTVPDEICRYYMQVGGVKIDEANHDQNLVLKLVSLATDYFVAGVVHDAGEFMQLRGGLEPKKSAHAGQTERCLRIRDVMLALQRQGVTTLHPIPQQHEADGQKQSVGGAHAQKRQRCTDTDSPSEPAYKRHMPDANSERKEDSAQAS